MRPGREDELEIDTALILESLGAARKFADPEGPLPGSMMAASGALPIPPDQIPPLNLGDRRLYAVWEPVDIAGPWWAHWGALKAYRRGVKGRRVVSGVVDDARRYLQQHAHFVAAAAPVRYLH